MSDEDAHMNKPGNVCWHSSEEDGGPDVGISVGLGGGMLFVGEVPGLIGGWSMAYYPASGDRIDVADTVNADEAREVIEKIALVIQRAARKETPNAE